MEDPAWVLRQLGPDFKLFVCCVVVQHDVKPLIWGN